MYFFFECSQVFLQAKRNTVWFIYLNDPTWKFSLLLNYCPYGKGQKNLEHFSCTSNTMYCRCHSKVKWRMSHIRGYVSREYCFHFMQVLQSTLLNLKKSICINLIYGSLLWLQQGKKKRKPHSCTNGVILTKDGQNFSTCLCQLRSACGETWERTLAPRTHPAQSRRRTGEGRVFPPPPAPHSCSSPRDVGKKTKTKTLPGPGPWSAIPGWDIGLKWKDVHQQNGDQAVCLAGLSLPPSDSHASHSPEC